MSAPEWWSAPWPGDADPDAGWAAPEGAQAAWTAAPSRGVLWDEPREGGVNAVPGSACGVTSSAGLATLASASASASDSDSAFHTLHPRTSDRVQDVHGPREAARR